MLEQTPARVQTQQILQRLTQLSAARPDSLATQPQFQEKVVLRAVERSLQIGTEKRAGLQRLFGDELSTLVIPETNGEMGQTNIFESLLEDVFDGGTSKDRKCDIPGFPEPFQEGAVPILTRSSFITRVLQEHRIQDEKQLQNDPHDVSIGLIDLHNLRGADFEVGQGDKPADVLINKAARAIRTTFQELGYAIKDIEKQGKSWEIGRYGGDEFVIGLFGNFSADDKQKIYKGIQERLARPENHSYYQYEEPDSSKVIKREPIQLKANSNGEVVEVVEFPKGGDLESLPNRRLMFKEYLERGLLLTDEEFNRVVTKYSPEGKLDINLYRKDYPETASNYPPDVTNMQDRIAHIQKQHPELSFYFDLAQVMDEADKTSPDVDHRRRILLEVVENSLFDRLIGEAIYSRDQFQQYVQDGEFDSVTAIDLKFIKELNEKTTYADADIAIKSLWMKVKNSLSLSDREKIVVGRFGGTFALGIRRGSEVTQQAMEEIQSIQDLKLTFGKNEFVVPIANTTTPISTDNLKVPENILKRTLMQNETNFYERLIAEIIAEDIDKPNDRFVYTILEGDIGRISSDGEGISKKDLYTLFLNGKRKTERVNKLLASFHYPKADGQTVRGIDMSRLIDQVRENMRMLSGGIAINDYDHEPIFERLFLLTQLK